MKGIKKVKLLTKEIEKKIPREVNTEENGRVYVKWFHPFHFWKWYGMTYDPEDGIFFGYVHGDFPEFGSWALDELEGIRVMTLPVERDLYWDDKTTIDKVVKASQDGYPL